MQNAAEHDGMAALSSLFSRPDNAMSGAVAYLVQFAQGHLHGTLLEDVSLQHHLYLRSAQQHNGRSKGPPPSTHLASISLHDHSIPLHSDHTLPTLRPFMHTPPPPPPPPPSSYCHPREAHLVQEQQQAMRAWHGDRGAQGCWAMLSAVQLPAVQEVPGGGGRGQALSGAQLHNRVTRFCTNQQRGNLELHSTRWSLRAKLFSLFCHSLIPYNISLSENSIK